VSKLPLRFHPEVAEEIREAKNWYGEHSEAAKDQLVLALRRAFQQLGNNSSAGFNYIHGTKRLGLKKFPYVLVYRVKGGATDIVAFAHTKRRPGYWRNRLRRP
jgi:plasmid stabilization system protein ParE